MLIYTPQQNGDRISNFAQLDSVITSSMADHNIRPDQWRVSSTDVDSIFVRKTYRVRVPLHFSKTLFHYDLNRRIYGSDYLSPSRVTLPDNDIDIFLYKDQTIVRTIRMETDRDLDSLEVIQEVAWQTD